MKNKLWVITGFLLLLTGTVWAEPPRKVILVVFENASYKAAMDQPFFADFANKGTVLTNYFAIRHPSQPNYLAMVSGSKFYPFAIGDGGRLDASQS
jgi:hypothetical protein